MGQFNHQFNEEREYDRFREEASEELAEEGLIDSRKRDEQIRRVTEEEEEHQYKSSVDWDELSENIKVHVEPEKLRELIEEAVEKAGSAHALSREAGISQATVYKWVHGEGEIVEIGTLKKLLDYLEIPHDEIDQYIIGIGGSGDQIKEPKLPFDFDSEEGAIVIAAALKDGCLSGKGHAYFGYVNKDEENIERVKRVVKEVFGEIEPSEVRDENASRIYYVSLAIVEALEKIGVPVGSKVEQEYHVPEAIREGDEDVKRAYLYQAMMDEGCWTYDEEKERVERLYYAQVSALREEELTKEEREYLDELCSRERELPSGVISSYVSITEKLEEKIKEEHPYLWEVIEGSKPPFLEEEMDMLEEVTGVRPKLEPIEIHKTSSGEYRVTWKAGVYTSEVAEKIINGLGLLPKKREEEDEE